MKATRIIITGHDAGWAAEAAAAMTGFGTSVIACGIETAVECDLSPAETPDGRPGVAILAFAVSGSELEKQIPRRIGQCVLTCPSAAIFAGIDDGGSLASHQPLHQKRVPMGKTIRYFGDGHQISKVTGNRRYWRVPVMDGEFICEHDVARVDGIGGGNFILIGDSFQAVSLAVRAAVAAMKPMPGIITPFPGGVARSGSKVGSKYKSLFASTNDAFCPILRTMVESKLLAGENAALEIVIDGLSFDEISHSIKVGITAACKAAGGYGLRRVTAGNYGGKLGKHHFHLSQVMQ